MLQTDGYYSNKYKDDNLRTTITHKVLLHNKYMVSLGLNNIQ